MHSQRNLIFIAGLLGGLAVLLGAFGAHALQLTDPQSGWYQTASQYHFYHSLALLLVALLPIGTGWKKAVSLLWVFGVVLFSGSLYGAATGLMDWFWLTPLGGLLLLGGWLALVAGVIFSYQSLESR